MSDRMFSPTRKGPVPERGDPFFEPHADFNFEDDPSVIAEAYGGHGGFPMYGNMQSGFNGQGTAGLSDMMWSDPFDQNSAGGAGLPPSTQRQIADNCPGVIQRFGQITPPESGEAEKLQKTQASDAAKRKERARNAANKRHAKTKKAKAGSESEDEDAEGAEVRGERQAHYREKNRVAAAKCRAKKKNHNDNLEELHRDEANKNKILKSEMMSLRNELAQLKELTLEHSPDTCQCHGIHEYSMRQANLIARGAAPQYGPVVSSPSENSQQSAGTPISTASYDGLFSMHDQMLSPQMGQMSRKPSLAAPNGWMQS